MEVVDVEVKITSMQVTHIFRRDQTTQVLKCTPWSTRLCPHPTIIKKMKTFFEVEWKMGPVPASQFKPPLPDTNPSIRKDNATEKRKRAAPKRFRPAAPKPTAVHPPLPEASPKPKNDVPDMGPHLQFQFQFARVLHGLVQAKCQAIYSKIETDYLDNGNENKIENEPKIAASVTSPRPPIKEEEESKINNQATEKCGWGPDCPFCKNPEKEDWDGKHQNTTTKSYTQTKITKTTG